jgi:hypothetical protein
MAARDYLTLVNDFIFEFQISDGVALGSFSGVTGEKALAIGWIKTANTMVAGLWTDWRFLWKQWSTSLSVGSQVPTLPTVAANAFEFKQFDRTMFYLNYGTSTKRLLTYQDYRDFRVANSDVAPTRQPAMITELPDRTLKLDAKADQSYTFSCEGWKRPTLLAATTDVPDLPREYDRIIIVRAAMLYAAHVDAPEVLESAEAEYVDILEKLEASELPDRQIERMSSQDLYLAVEVPGMETGRSSVTR